jgi:glycosyltransferase involved in cell wall biosynthesis
LRHKWGVEEGELVLLYVGKFQAVKNLPELFLALAQLGALAPPLVLVGSGPEEQNWRGLARELGLRVIWHGFANQSELPAIYRAADVLVLPSRRETWGLVVNEGMACGLPALVSDAVGCMPDLVLENETGWVYPSGDVSALAAVLRQIAEAPSRVRSMRGTVIRHVERVCSLEELVEGTLAAVRAVAAGGKR